VRTSMLTGGEEDDGAIADSTEGRAARGPGVVAALLAMRRVGEVRRAWTKKRDGRKGENGMTASGF
jgi:hypothetical protein